MASSIMDFLMLALVGGGALFVYINRECIMSGSCFGGGGGDVCATQPTAPGCPQDPCVLNPNAAGCGGGTGGDDPSKCSSQYNGSCNGECGSGTKCTSSACTNCMKACGSSKAPAACRGGSQGSQCSRLCSSKDCIPQWNQCSSDCSNCPWISRAQSIISTGKSTNSAYDYECGRYSNPIGVRCRACRKCPSGTTYCGARVLIAGRTNSAVVNDMLSTWQQAHPSGCAGGGGTCTKTCSGGYVLNKSDCSCICNSSVKNCGSGSKCLYHTSSACTCYDTGIQAKCPSGYHTTRNSGGQCDCAKNTGGGGGGSCPGKCTQGSQSTTQCCNFTGQTFLSCCCGWRGSHGGCASGFKGVPASGGGCNCVKSSYTKASYMTMPKQAVLARYNPNSYRVRLA